MLIISVVCFFIPGLQAISGLFMLAFIVRAVFSVADQIPVGK